MGLMPASQSIKTKKKFTIDEICEILKTEGNLPSEPFINGSGIMRGLFVDGIGQFDVNIYSSGKKIVCCEAPKRSEAAKTLVLGELTDGWYSIIGRQNGIKEVVKAVADEVERLFKDRV